MRGLVLLILVAAVPPLSDSQLTRLDTAYDGRDHQEEAFAALLEHVSVWSGEVGDAPVRLRVDLEAMTGEPDAYRGDLCLLEGVLLQRTRLEPPFERAEEWFLRGDDGRPFVVYVVIDDEGIEFVDGIRVRLSARFYKRVDFEARDGVARSYAAFVGRFPRRVVTADDTATPWVVVVPVAIMMLVFLVLIFYARRIGASPGVRRRASVVEPEPEEAPLPDDPADALAELRRRAGEGDA